MVRLYQYPTVDPRGSAEQLRKSLAVLGEAADSDVPIAIFPEGTRTKNGEVGRFRGRGLQVLLSKRAWTVHMLVVDGYWRSAKLKHFVRGMAHIEGRIQHLGSVEWTDPSADPTEFIAQVRGRIVEGLDELRGIDGDPASSGADEKR
jgi:1-acyl-sn-glycerol-3-phosphate acyltransferase